MRRALIAAWLLLAPAVATAQARQCAVPDRLPPAPAAQIGERRIVPIVRYTLALSWSPEHCRDARGDPADSFQCGRPGRFGFVLHGLWPDGPGTRWPQYCRPAARVPEVEVRRMLCTTPSAKLIEHEWQRHGTCLTRDPARYFRLARGLFNGIRYPDMDALSRRRDLTAGQFARAFAAANPGMTPAMLRVKADRKGWLDEVHLCLGLTGRPRDCRPEDERAAPGSRLRIWRAE